MEYCTECGNPLEKHHHFCTNCGAKQVPSNDSSVDRTSIEQASEQVETDQSPAEASSLQDSSVESAGEQSHPEQPPDEQAIAGQPAADSADYPLAEPTTEESVEQPSIKRPTTEESAEQPIEPTSSGQAPDDHQPAAGQLSIGEQQQTRATAKQTAAAQNLKPMKKRTKIMIAAAVLFVAALFGTHMALSSYFDPMKDLQAMDQALASGNVDEFVSYIAFDNEALLNEQEYFQYIEEYEWESAKTQYADIIKAEDPLTSQITNSEGNPLFTVQPQEHLFGLYTSYSLSAEPSVLTVNTEMDETEIRIGGTTETINTEEPKEFAIYPGTYDIKGSASNMYGEFTYEDSIEILTRKEADMNIEFSGETYTFSTNQEDATLFVNGEDTGLTLGEIDSLGPIPENSDVKMHAEWTSPNGDVVKSETVTKNDLQFIGGIPFVFDETETQESEENEESKVASADTADSDAGDTVLAFRDAYEEALNTKDYSLIESYMKDGSEAEKGLQEYIGDLKETDYHYDFTSNEVVNEEQVDDETVKVTTNELFTFTNHRDEKTDYDRTKTYTMKLEDDDYKISLIEYDETNRDQQ